MLLIDKFSRCRAMVMGFAMTAALAGCTSRDAYAPPAGASADSMATIAGTRLDVAVPLVEDIRVLVSAVDGRLTSSSRYGWDKPTLITPGSRLVQIVALQGRLRAEIALRVTLEAGKIYNLRLNKPDVSRPPQVWLEDAQSGLVVGDKMDFGAGLIGVPEH